MKQTGFKYALRCACEFGGEAQANGRTAMTDDDKFDIAYYYDVERWRDIPLEHRKRLEAAFAAGVESERALINHLAHGGGILDDIEKCKLCN